MFLSFHPSPRLLDVEADGGAGGAGAGEAEDDPRAVGEDEAEALLAGDGAVDRVRVLRGRTGGGAGIVGGYRSGKLSTTIYHIEHFIHSRYAARALV